MPTLKRQSLIAIASYYKSINNQRLMADSIKIYAFLCVSLQSRCEIIDDLWTAFKESEANASVALAKIEAGYPKRWFKGIKP